MITVHLTSILTINHVSDSGALVNCVDNFACSQVVKLPASTLARAGAPEEDPEVADLDPARWGLLETGAQPRPVNLKFPSDHHRRLVG